MGFGGFGLNRLGLAGSVGWLRWAVDWLCGGVCHLLAGAMVVVKVVLSVATISIVPLQLCLECVVLLTEVLLSVMLGVAPPVAPLVCLVSWHVYVLEVVVSSIGAVGAWSRDRKGTSGGTVRYGHRVGQGVGQREWQGHGPRHKASGYQTRSYHICLC